MFLIKQARLRGCLLVRFCHDAKKTQKFFICWGTNCLFVLFIGQFAFVSKKLSNNDTIQDDQIQSYH